MSMDDQYIEMRRFKDELVRFNERLSSSMKDMKTQHDRIDAQWRDEMRRTYDAHWEPLEQFMKNYLEREGPGFVEFLTHKIRALEGYLYGR